MSFELVRLRWLVAWSLCIFVAEQPLAKTTNPSAIIGQRGDGTWEWGRQGRAGGRETGESTAVMWPCIRFHQNRRGSF